MTSRRTEAADPAAETGDCLLSLIIPTRNERDNAGPLLSKLADVLAELPYEVIFVDDSDDRTPEVATQAARETGVNLRVLHRKAGERAGGLSTAVLMGLAAAQGEYICIMDADLQHPPELIKPLVDRARESGAEIVIASRYVPGGTDEGLSGYSRKLISLGAKSLVKVLFFGRLRNVTDPLSGFFVARREMLNEAKLRPIGFKILLDILVRSHWEQVGELPLRFQRRAGGESKATLAQGRTFLAHVWTLLIEVRLGRAPARASAGVTPPKRERS